MEQPDYNLAGDVKELESRVDDLEMRVGSVEGRAATDPKDAAAIKDHEKRVAKVESTLQQLRGDDGIQVKLPVIALTDRRGRDGGTGMPAGYEPVPLHTCLNGVAASMNVIGTTPQPIVPPP